MRRGSRPLLGRIRPGIARRARVGMPAGGRRSGRIRRSAGCSAATSWGRLRPVRDCRRHIRTYLRWRAISQVAVAQRRSFRGAVRGAECR